MRRKKIGASFCGIAFDCDQRKAQHMLPIGETTHAPDRACISTHPFRQFAIRTNCAACRAEVDFTIIAECLVPLLQDSEISSLVAVLSERVTRDRILDVLAIQHFLYEDA